MQRNRLWSICLNLLTAGVISLSLTSCVQDTGTVWRTEGPVSQQAPLPPGPVASSSAMPPSQIPYPSQGQTMPAAQPMPLAKVALLLPLSGKGSDVGASMLNAAQLAMFDLGAGSFELMPRDTGGTPDGAQQAAASAMQEGASLVLGPLFAGDVKTIAPVTLQRGVNVVSFTTDMSSVGANVFTLGFLPQTQIRQIVSFAASQNLRRIALIAPQDVYGSAVADTFDLTVRQTGLTNSGIIRYSGSGPTADQLTYLIGHPAAGQKPFDAVLIAAGGRDAAQISDQLSAMGYPPYSIQRLGTGLWDQPETASLPALQGAWYAASSPRLRSRYESRYRETYGEAPHRLSSLAYDATALAVVLRKSGKGFDRATLLDRNGFSGIDGIFRLNPDGTADRGLAILEIRGNAARVIREAPGSFAGR